MSAFLAVLCLGAVICSLLTGSEQELSSAAAESAVNAGQLWLTLAAAMMFWSGLMRVAEKCGIVDRLCRIVTPFLLRLMPDARRNGEAVRAAALNISSNLLGLGNAATPFGIKAMKELTRCECSRRSLAGFVLLNTASVQLVPMNIISLRAGAGSTAPADCVLPVIVNSAIALLCGLIMTALLYGGRKCSCSV